MPGDGPFKRQIAMLTVAYQRDGKAWSSRGTGFLIGARRLVTAYHVVGSRKAKRLYGRVTVDFFDLDTPANNYQTTAAVVSDDVRGPLCDPDKDWAILDCDADVPGAEHLRPRLPVPRSGDPWRSFGYSAGTDHRGMAFTGKVTSHHPELQLDCDQAHKNARVKGLSGAPCLVDEHVVGVIINASDPEGDGYPKDGVMFIRSIADLAAICPMVRSLMPPPSPPFTRQVGAELEREGVISLLPEAGKVIKLPAVEQVEPRRLAPLVAEHILHRGPLEAVEVMQPLAPQLDPTRAERILDLAASVWISGDATRMLADAVLSGPPRTVIGINAASLEMGERFVHRAGYPTASHPGWRTRMRAVPEPAAERRVEDFVVKARLELCKLVGGAADDELDAECAYEISKGRPLILVVPPKPPPAEAVERLHGKLPMVRVVLLCEHHGLADLQARYPAAIVVRPELAAGEEARAKNHHRRGTQLMADCYENLRTKAAR